MNRRTSTSGTARCRLAARALACALALSAWGCAGRQEPCPQPQSLPTEPEPPSADHLGRVRAALAAQGIDRDELRCNSITHWATGLDSDARALAVDVDTLYEPNLRRMGTEARDELRSQVAQLAQGWLIRTTIVSGDHNNLGAFALPQVTWTDESGESHALVVFHSGFTPEPAAPASCLRSLLGAGRVRHVINLYDGDLPLGDLVQSESAVAREAGATYVDASDPGLGYQGWRAVAGDEQATDQARQEAQQSVARLLRDQILAPAGSPPRGNVYVHCGGGMHRSMIVMGVLRRCVAGDPIEVIAEAMRAHGDYESAERPGGFEAANLAFVEAFDCALLPAAPTTATDGADATPGPGGETQGR